MSVQEKEYQFNIAPGIDENLGQSSLVEQEQQYGNLGELTNHLSSFKRRHRSLPALDAVFGVPKLAKNQILPVLKPIEESQERHTL